MKEFNGGATEIPVQEQPRVVWKRWLILVIFISLSLSNAFQWIEYAIIGDVVTRYYGVPYLAVDWTSMIYMLNYIPLILPATWILDKYGLRIVALLGSFGNCLGAMVKCASASPDRFWVTFLGQTISGSSQIFILGIPPRLAAVWFGPREVSTATALGVFGNQLGIAIGFFVPPILVSVATHNITTSEVTGEEEIPQEYYDEIGPRLLRLFLISAGVNAVIFILVLAFFRDSPEVPPSPAQQAAIAATMETNYVKSLKSLVTNKNYLLLVASYGINVGAFYAVSTLLNQMVLFYYPTEQVNVGRIGFVIIVAGMVGSVVCGLWLDCGCCGFCCRHTFKLTTLTVYIFSFLGMVMYTFTINLGHLWVVFLVAALLGFFMTGYLPLGFEFGAELTYPVSEGTVSGLLNASAQMFGVSMTLSAGVLLNNVSIWWCNIALCVALFIGIIITALIRNDLRRQAAGKAQMAVLDNEEGIQKDNSTAPLMVQSPSDDTLEPNLNNKDSHEMVDYLGRYK